MAKELELKDYKEGSDIDDNLIAKTSVYNDIEYVDNIAFDQQFEGIYPQNMPLGASKLQYSAVGVAPIPYDVNATGAFAFGDGSDGVATISGNTTLTRDMYYRELIIDSGAALNPGGFKIYSQGRVWVQNGSIARNGNNGSDGEDASGGDGATVGGAGGAALAEGTLRGSVAGQQGGNSNANQSGGAGNAGTATTQSLGSNGSAGGAGGTSGGVPTGGAGGAGGTATANQVSLKNNWHLFSMFDITSSGTLAKYNTSAGAGSGGGGGSNSGTNAGGAGGGSGSGGGMIWICAGDIIVESSGSITANGGNGGAGGDGLGTGNAVGPGGGGAGGNGGEIILLYNREYVNRGTVTASAGTGGAAGALPNAGGQEAVAGASGTAGTVRTFKISI